MPGGSGGLAADLAETPPNPGSRWADLRLRALTAVLLGPVVLAILWVGGAPFLAFVGILALGLAWEWLGLCRAGRWRMGMRLGGVAGVILWAGLLGWLRADPMAGRANVIGLVLIVWASDIGAYLAGRLIGGPKLAPRISPGKTWAGAVGGLAASAVVSMIAASILMEKPDFGLALLIGAFLSVCGQAGDLAESAAKRRCGVKDSGRLVPGHGGLLDRLDAMMAAVPAAALLSFLLGRGVILWR